MNSWEKCFKGLSSSRQDIRAGRQITAASVRHLFLGEGETFHAKENNEIIDDVGAERKDIYFGLKWSK